MTYLLRLFRRAPAPPKRVKPWTRAELRVLAVYLGNVQDSGSAMR